VTTFATRNLSHRLIRLRAKRPCQHPVLGLSGATEDSPAPYHPHRVLPADHPLFSGDWATYGTQTLQPPSRNARAKRRMEIENILDFGMVILRGAGQVQKLSTHSVISWECLGLFVIAFTPNGISPDLQDFDGEDEFCEKQRGNSRAEARNWIEVWCNGHLAFQCGWDSEVGIRTTVFCAGEWASVLRTESNTHSLARQALLVLETAKAMETLGNKKLFQQILWSQIRLMQPLIQKAPFNFDADIDPSELANGIRSVRSWLNNHPTVADQQRRAMRIEHRCKR
jgi:hypothetical protein